MGISMIENLEDETLVRHTLVDSYDPLALELARRLEGRIEFEAELCRECEVISAAEIEEKLSMADSQVAEFEDLKEQLWTKAREIEGFNVDDEDEWQENLDSILQELDTKGNQA